MSEIKFETGNGEPAAFNLYDEGRKIGEMIVEINGTDLTVYHTEVDEDQSGKGYAGQLLASMVNYVRAHNLKVIPLCPYVHAQFKRHPDLYGDIWNRTAE
ncbi:GNAT family N-acetyltransferase [Pedobacter punctiformis]|uniref:GNAT family N-acetyltransferase n=1 Tax=Pedobacter punctiformis TaxID=3004097 RepID=A0ABT4L966_9SPHI|nr:GNAT family N-acetyltransferase [Pedobacter sp. HCMS5-2]MCZ4244376.1 GNAT family N-acetyltransferase [Pedobacter sp. HCMS5-2]